METFLIPTPIQGRTIKNSSTGILTPATPYDENELFLHISRGDESAFRRLFELYRQRLFAFAWQLCHSAVDAEEIVQDVFLRLWEQREKLPEVSMPRKYIY